MAMYLALSPPKGVTLEIFEIEPDVAKQKAGAEILKAIYHSERQKEILLRRLADLYGGALFSPHAQRGIAFVLSILVVLNLKPGDEIIVLHEQTIGRKTKIRPKLCVVKDHP